MPDETVSRATAEPGHVTAMPRTRRSWRPPPLVLAIAATLGAAGLVFYLQHRAMTALQLQNQVIVRQIAEQTAADIAVELRRTLDGPIFDTLAAVNHPELRAGRLRPGRAAVRQGPRGLSARRSLLRLERGRRRHPGQAPRRAVLRAKRRVQPRPRARSGGARPGPAACRHQQIYIAAEGIGADQRQVLLRLFWTDARRGRVLRRARLRHRAGEHAPAAVRRAARPGLRRRAAAAWRRGPAAAAHHRRHRRRRLRDAAARGRGGPAARSRCCSIRPRTSARASPSASRRGHGRSKWARPPSPAAMAGAGQRYWPTVLSILLMLVALGSDRAGPPPLDRAGPDAGRLRRPRVAPAQDPAVAAERRHRDAADGPHPLAREAVGVPRHDSGRDRPAVGAGAAGAGVLARPEQAQLRVRAGGPRRAGARDRRRLRPRPGQPPGPLRGAAGRARPVRARRPGGARAGGRQPARQRRQVFAPRPAGDRQGPRRTAQRGGRGDRPRHRHPVERARPDLRALLPRAGRRRTARASASGCRSCAS